MTTTHTSASSTVGTLFLCLAALVACGGRGCAKVSDAGSSSLPPMAASALSTTATTTDAGSSSLLPWLPSGFGELDSQTDRPLPPLPPLPAIAPNGVPLFDHFNGPASLIDREGRTWIISTSVDMPPEISEGWPLPRGLQRIDYRGGFYYFLSPGGGIQSVGLFERTSDPDYRFRNQPTVIAGLESALPGIVALEVPRRYQFYAVSRQGQLLTWQEYAELKSRCVDPESGDVTEPHIGYASDNCPYQWVVSAVREVQGQTYDRVISSFSPCLSKGDQVFCAKRPDSFEAMSVPIAAPEIADMSIHVEPGLSGAWVLARDGRLYGTTNTAQPWSRLPGRWRRVAPDSQFGWFGLDAQGTVWSLGKPIGKQWKRLDIDMPVRDIGGPRCFLKGDGTVWKSSIVSAREDAPVKVVLSTNESPASVNTMGTSTGSTVGQPPATASATATATTITASTATATATHP
jgi:hypothetical protein